MEEHYRIDANFRWLASAVKANEELYLAQCGIERCLPDKFYGPSVREEYHVHIILYGHGILKINGVSHTLHRGQLFVIPPGVETYYYSVPEDPWSYTWVSFSGTRASFFLEKAGITLEQPVRDTYVEPEDFLKLTEEILNHHELTVANELIRTSLLYKIVALLVDSKNQKAAEEKIKKDYDYSPDIYVNSALEFIHKHYNEIRVSDIASYIGISRYYLTHIFKEKLHVSPQEYLLNYRMNQGSQLLRTIRLSIQEISERVGYENPLTFSKIFKSVYGLSPKNYRNKILEETKD